MIQENGNSGKIELTKAGLEGQGGMPVKLNSVATGMKNQHEIDHNIDTNAPL
jgi:hypothetical protein